MKSVGARGRMLRIAGVRVVILPLSTTASLASAWLIVRDLGVEQFGLISLVTTLTLLLPFADLGLSAPVINAFASRAYDRHVTLSVAWTWLWLVAASLTASIIALHTLLGWGNLLGTEVAPGAVSAALVLFACSVPFGVGMRVLTGLGRVATVTALQGIYPVAAVTFTVLAYASGRSTLYLLAPSLAQLLTAVGTFVFAARLLSSDYRWWTPNFGAGGPMARMFRGGIPMLVISAGLALALQSHRLVLSHWSTSEALGDYALTMTLYAPTWAFLSGVALQLWSHFTAARSDPTVDLRREFFSRWRDVSVMGLVFGSALALGGPIVCDIVYGRSGTTGLWVAAGLLLAVQAIHIPAGMYLTEGRHLVFQAGTVLAMTAATIPMSIILASRVGAAGPVSSSAIGVVLFQLVPCLILVHHLVKPDRGYEPHRAVHARGD